MQLKVTRTDITKMETDAIVNAANPSLTDGSGVNGAIHQAAGEELSAACRALHGCKTGEAKLTEGYRLPADYVIHTVGPVWRGGNQNEAKLLADCYRNSLRIAKKQGFHSIAFPAISTGIYGYPAGEASEIAVQTILEETADTGEDFTVWLVAFDEKTEKLYQEEIRKILG